MHAVEAHQENSRVNITATATAAKNRQAVPQRPSTALCAGTLPSNAQFNTVCQVQMLDLARVPSIHSPRPGTTWEATLPQAILPAVPGRSIRQPAQD